MKDGTRGSGKKRTEPKRRGKKAVRGIVTAGSAMSILDRCA